MDGKLKKLAFKFLNVNFPITRIKKGNSNKFYRGVIIPSEMSNKFITNKYYIRNKSDLKDLYLTLNEIIELTFDIPKIESTKLIDKHLNLT